MNSAPPVSDKRHGANRIRIRVLSLVTLRLAVDFQEQGK